MLSLNKEHHWNLWMHVGSVLTHRLQLDIKAREAFLQVWTKGAGAHWDFLTVGCAEVHLEGEECSSKGLSRRNICGFSQEVST